MTDHFRYDLLTQQALRGVVRTVLAEAAKRKGLPGDHHFYISFDTTAEGVRMSERLRVQYPEQMTVILQHQFWDLAVQRARLRGRAVVRRHSGEAVDSVRGGHRLLRPVGAVRPAVRGGGRGRGPPVAGQCANRAGQAGQEEARHPAGARRRGSGGRGNARAGRGRQAGQAGRAAPRWFRSIASARRNSTVFRRPEHRLTVGHGPKPGKVRQKARAKTRQDPKATPSGRSTSPPTDSGARRPSARCTISASAPSACRSRSCTRSA